jgi:alpha-L-arabinofuranosidase
MKIKYFLFLIILSIAAFGFVNTDKEANDNKLIVYLDSSKYTISKHIYGHFSEHLGRCIYDGLWVGKNSAIPNTEGVRNDVIDAFKKIKVPNLRWPGGCFADDYHWMNGIGPQSQRRKMINTFWGGVEDNSFGTHEFLNFCELIGTEPYLSANVGSGTVEEMEQWVQYVNSDMDDPMAELRRKNGREKSWKVKFWGVGNESWGCGGNMNAEYYSDVYQRYATYCHSYSGNNLYKVACGGDYDWTKVLMKKTGSRMNGMSLHYYTVSNWANKGSAIKFSEEDYIQTMSTCLGIEDVIRNHIKIMDEYDPDKKIGLMVDEWGTWFDAEPNQNLGALYQQNTLRDAFVAATSLNVFNKYADRIKMANLAQAVNVLQALILTSGDKMILTPTYHVFDMYKVHQDATFIPSKLTSENYSLKDKTVPALSVSCSKSSDGTINISIVNLNPAKNIPFECELKGGKNMKSVSGKILTAATIQSYNSFENPETLKINPFKDYSLKNNNIRVQVPAKSVIVLEIK